MMFAVDLVGVICLMHRTLALEWLKMPSTQQQQQQQ
jgi:hypothetical protein